MKENRIRPIQKKFYVTPDEWDFIMAKVKQAGMKNYGDYVREMAMKGYVIEVDYSAVKELTKEIGSISRNINQIAKRVNATGAVYREDMDEIKKMMEQVWQGLRFILSNQP